ncbi:MAG TPA: substrate-binding domain-containing protein [Spirochaetia bacterium]|nr:substrate-binding domain-containing protein [Spirochaetia bacterium]
MRRLLLVLAVALAAAGMVVAAPKVKIAVSMPTADHGWMAGANWWAQKAISDWKAKDPDIDFSLVTADTAQKQASDIEDLLVKKINGIVVFPYDDSLTTVVEKAYKQGVYTVVLDRGTTKPVYDVWLRNDDQAYARQGMNWVASQLKGKGNVVLIEGIPSPINTIRVDTAKAVAGQYPGIKILDSQPGNWNRQKALEVMQNYLQKYKQIDAVYTADDDMLLGALQAYKESGRKDIKVWLGGGGSKELVKKIIDNSDPLIKADVTYPPDVVATGVSLAVLGVRGRVFEGFYQKKLPVNIILNSEFIDSKNANDYYHPDAPF